jgi:hypothetical protein
MQACHSSYLGSITGRNMVRADWAKIGDRTRKITKAKKRWNVAQVAEGLPSKCVALNLNLIDTEKTVNFVTKFFSLQLTSLELL